MERIDTMEAQLSEWKSTLNAFDEVKWDDRILESEVTINLLKQLESDTIPLDDAVNMDTYQLLQANIILVISQQIDHLEEVDLAEKRLKKLHADIESGSGRRDKYDDFLAIEEKQLMLLESKVTSFESMLKDLESQYPDVQKSVNRIIAERLPETAVQ